MKIGQIVEKVQWCVCPRSHTSTHRQHSTALKLLVEADRNRESGSCVCRLSFHSLVGQGTRHCRLGSASYRHRNNESSSVFEIALLSLKCPKALSVFPSVKKTVRKEVHRENNHVRVCRQQTLAALDRARIRATAARSWRLNGRDTKLISVHSPPHSKHTAFGSYCCLLWEACGLKQMRCVNKKQSFLMLQRALYIVTAVAGNVWFVFNIMDYMIMFSMCGSGGNGSQHLG